MNIEQAIEILNINYYKHTWDHNDIGQNDEEKMTVPWPGEEDEEIMISVHKDVGIHQKFHRHSYFFVNFAYQGDFKALSINDDQIITLHQNDCYMAQPYSGYAIVADKEQNNTIVAIMIRRSTFFKEMFSLVARSPKLFDFFVSVEKNPKSDTALYIPFEDDAMIRPLVELMIMEYAAKDENTQQVLKPLVLTFFLYLMRQYEKTGAKQLAKLPLSLQLETYIRSNCATVTLKELSMHFSYHPNYLSGYLKRELGKGFSQIVLDQRMANAKSLLAATSLSIEEVAGMTGYTSPSNFYKAFKDYYQTTPRDYIASLDNSAKA